jgi:hypothetical protein
MLSRSKYKEMDMNKIKLMLNALAVFVVCLACSTLAQAQASRTWVSGVGDDVNPCSRTAPCKTFAGAISKTAAGGEISVLDPGGYGAVTITKSITIDGGTGAGWGSILASLGSGVIVNAGANDDVVLRNLSINGINGTNSPGTNGVRFLAGRNLVVENCTIYGFSTHGIDMAHTGVGTGQLAVINTTFSDINSVAVRIARTAGTTQAASLSNIKINKASFGVDVLNGIAATISNSTISHVTNQAVVAENTSTINVVSSVLSHSGKGIEALSSGSTVNFANCDIFNNGTGLSIVAGATGNRFGNSRIQGNTTNENVVGTLNLGTNR